MQFSFKNYLKKIVSNHSILIILTFLLVIYLYYFTDFEHILIIVILSLCLFSIAFSFFTKYNALKTFIRKIDISQQKKIELSLSNSAYQYRDLFLTDNYIFGLNKMIIIKYENIMSIKIAIGYSLKPSFSSGIIYKETITLKNGKKYSFKINIINYKKVEIFNTIIKSKNPDIVIKP